MSSLLAIDSGYPECAVAAAREDRLVRVGSVTRCLTDASSATYASWVWRQWERVIVEIPTMRGAATPNPEDLLLIAVTGARLAEAAVEDSRCGQIREVRPAEWKGNTPKPAHHARMLDALLDAEYALLGGDAMKRAVEAACRRGAADRWRKPGARYYRASELPTVGNTKITHDMLDAAALALYALGRIKRG